MKEMIVFSVENQSCICVMHHNSNWLVNSGATHHTTPWRDIFVVGPEAFHSSFDDD